jgi:hypothetical protein
MIRKTRAICLGGAIATLASQGVAQTQGAAADALFSTAQAEMEKHDFDAACGHFRESDRLDPAVGTKLNLALCEEKRNRLATALDLLRAVVEKAEATDERRAMAQDLANKLDARVPRLRVKPSATAPKDMSAREGDLVLGGASFGVALPMNPGPHRFIVAASGYRDRMVVVELHEGEAQDLVLEPGLALSGKRTVGDVATEAPAAPRPKTLGYVLGGIGVVGVGVGAVTGIMALGQKSTADQNCNDAQRTCTQAGKDANDAGSSLMTVSTVGWIVGAAGLVGAGAYFVLTGRGNEKPATVLNTRIIPGAVSASVIGSW